MKKVKFIFWILSKAFLRCKCFLHLPKVQLRCWSELRSILGGHLCLSLFFVKIQKSLKMQKALHFLFKSMTLRSKKTKLRLVFLLFVYTKNIDGSLIFSSISIFSGSIFVKVFLNSKKCSLKRLVKLDSFILI